ncbi:uncharacterized protein LOC125140072 [Tachysurus fulvidraco]|uniref:uncharacterized protein LOC125140072 n=1 Tax=Tachysurus fulvidraco TaxID=1234273 RepID=UPI001FEF7391|nr:uncharacterized protein LOC125140072 [Tachysurus fulvidraco]
MSSLPLPPPVKLEFPSFSNGEEEDPVIFLERCEEYFALCPLCDYEILASLTSVLKGTAKDWWLAEKKNVKSWQQFKEVFLQSFLSEDYEEEVARKLMERKQGAKENIRDFAYHYRVLCLRKNKDMTDKEIVHAILRNCNPRLASLLRGNVKGVSELVRIGTQIERDFEESKRYWNQVNSESQQRKTTIAREATAKPSPANTRVMQPVKSLDQPEMVTLPIILQGRLFQALVDTGSTLSLIKEAFWKQLRGQEPCKTSNGQSFLLANGLRQEAIGKVVWECELQEKKMDVTLYIMRDTNLTVPLILGMDFLWSSGIVLDFRRSQYRLTRSEESGDEEVTFPLMIPESCASLHFYLAIPLPRVSEDTQQSIRDLVIKTNTNQQNKSLLEELMLNWPTVCTNEIGRTSIVKHRLITCNDES